MATIKKKEETKEDPKLASIYLALDKEFLESLNRALLSGKPELTRVQIQLLFKASALLYAISKSTPDKPITPTYKMAENKTFEFSMYSKAFALSRQMNSFLRLVDENKHLGAKYMVIMSTADDIHSKFSITYVYS